MKYCDICGLPIKGKIVHTFKAWHEKEPENTFIVTTCDSCYQLVCDYEDKLIQKEKLKVL